MNRFVFGVALGAMWFVACGGSTSPAQHVEATERAPRVLPVDGDPNGLWWDETESKLYLADDDGNRILDWSDAAGFAVFRELPTTSPERAGLGQLVRTSDGSIIVTRFGFGKRGDVAVIPPTGDVRIVPGLDGARRRIGLTAALDGTLYDAWFVKQESGRAGAVGQLSLDGAEPEIMTGLTKPVGVLAIGDQLFVSDQDQNQIVTAPRSSPAAYRVFATFPRPDLLAAGPDGSIFSGSASGSVYRISSSGDATVFHAGFQQVRGVAYDAARRRLFVVEHDADENDGVHNALHILPVD